MNKLDIEKEIFARLFQLSNKLQTYLDSILKTDKLTAKQFFLMIVVYSFADNPPTLSELSNRVGSSRQNVKQIVLKLEKQGFLELKNDEKDKRIIRIFLTDLAVKYWDNRSDKDILTFGKIFNNITLDQVTVLNNVLGNIYNNVMELE